MLEATVTKECAVAWKCPHCSSMAAAATRIRACMSMRLKIAQRSYLSMDEVKALLTQDTEDALLAKCGVKPDAQSHFDPSDIRVTVSPFDGVRCPACSTMPSWSEHAPQGGFDTIFESYLLLILALIICGCLAYSGIPMPVLAVIIILLGAVAVSVPVKLRHSIANQNSETPMEPLHQPLITFQPEVPADPTDPRNETLRQFLREHPQTSFQTSRKCCYSDSVSSGD